MNKGFTLIELTIAMAVMMVVLGVILLNTSNNSRDYRTLYSAARILQADMRYAQRKAVMEGRRIYVFFDLSANRYFLGSSPSEEYRSVDLLDGVTFVPFTTFQRHRAGFLPRGTASDAGTITLQMGRYQRQITVIPGGGRVEIRPADIIGGN